MAAISLGGIWKKISGGTGKGGPADAAVPYMKDMVGGQVMLLADDLDASENQAVGDVIVTCDGGKFNLFVDAANFGTASVKVYLRRSAQGGRPVGAWCPLRKSDETEKAYTQNTVEEISIAAGVEVSCAVTGANASTSNLYVEIR